MKKTELHIVDVGCVPVHETAHHALSLKLDPVSTMPPVTLDLSGWGVPATGPTAQPAAPATEAADWWNAPTYTTDLIPPFQCAVSVSLSSGEVGVNGGLPATRATAQPAAPTEAADWWKAPTYSDDLIPRFHGAVTVTLSSGDAAAKAE